MIKRYAILAALGLLLAASSGHGATRLEFPGGWYGAARPDGVYVVGIRGSHLETSSGRIEFPEGQDPLYLDLSPVGPLRFAGQGARDNAAWEWAGAWHVADPVAFGVNPALYLSSGALLVSHGGAVGSQGYRYEDETGRVWTGDETYADPGRHVWEYTTRGGITIGQGGDEEGAHALFNGRRVLLEPGICRFIRFKRDGDRLAVAIAKFAERKTVLLWLTVAELEALPDYTLPGPAPRPEPEPEPEPVPQDPASLLEDVKAERAKIAGQPTKAQLGAILNRVAWRHRAEGWGLSVKGSGNNCPTPPPAAKLIACDILHHQPSDQLYDVFGDVDGAASPTWGKAAHHNRPDRPWLAPVKPADETEPEPQPDPEPSPELEARLEALEARVSALVVEIAGVHEHVAALEARPNGVPIDQVNALISAALAGLRVVGGTSRDLFHGHKIDLQVVR
jgi:hypothetical protein